MLGSSQKLLQAGVSNPVIESGSLVLFGLLSDINYKGKGVVRVNTRYKMYLA